MSAASVLIEKELVELINFRIERETYSSYLYEQMQLWLDDNAYKGASKLWTRWSGEELVHAGWSKEFLLSFDIQPVLRTIAKPEFVATSIVDIIRLSYEHEIIITKEVSALATAALNAGNMSVFALAQKYVAEQIEEVNKVQNLMTFLSTYGQTPQMLFLLDSNIEEYAY